MCCGSGSLPGFLARGDGVWSGELGAEDDVGDGFDARDGLVARDEVDDVGEGCGVFGFGGRGVGGQRGG